MKTIRTKTKQGRGVVPKMGYFISKPCNENMQRRCSTKCVHLYSRVIGITSQSPKNLRTVNVHNFLLSSILFLNLYFRLTLS